MKKYFVETRINYTANYDGSIYNDTESFTFIVEAKSKVSARQLSGKLTKDSLMSLTGDIDEILSIKVIDLYETTEDARL